MSKLAGLSRKLSNYQLPFRKDSRKQPLPVRHIWKGEYGFVHPTFLDLLNITIIDDSLKSLIREKDCCVWPVQCRFFSLEVNDEPYYTRSITPFYEHRYKPRIPRKLFITKECAIRVNGFRRVRRTCPFKSLSSLDSFDKFGAS